VSFFVHPGELCRPLHKLVVDVQRRTHMHEYASIRHLSQDTPDTGRRAAFLGKIDRNVALQDIKWPRNSCDRGKSIAGSSRMTEHAGPSRAAQCVIARPDPHSSPHAPGHYPAGA
jgi:hypothetical protein